MNIIVMNLFYKKQNYFYKYYLYLNYTNFK